MKILKLAGIFAVIVGVLVLILNWGSIFSSTDTEEQFPEEDQLDVEQRCSRIRKAWSENNAWNQDLYDKQRAELKQDSAMHLFSHASYNIVRTCIRESATDNVYRCYKSVLQQETYAHNKVTGNYKGIEHLREQELNMSADERAKEISAIHSLYKRVYDFARNEKHPIVPKFNTETLEWTSFSALQNGVLSMANSYRNNAKFNELKNIPGFVAALDQTKLRNITAPQRNGFYNKLSGQITDHFNQLEANEENIEKFNTVYKRYVGEESSIGVKDIAVSLQKMKKQLEPKN
ncbi:MAG: hypothetical protein K2L41_01285 [Muribaculaceae bacterium]|nr:hypothetical protein [Muribaculaceae bacterium]